MTPEQQALALWREWFSDRSIGGTANKGATLHGGNPFAHESDDTPYCFFCGNHGLFEEEHEADCIWVRAKALIEGKR